MTLGKVLYQRGRRVRRCNLKVEVPSVNVSAVIFTSPATAVRFTCLQVVDYERKPRQSERNPSRRGWCPWHQERSSLICDSRSQATEH